MCTSTKIKNGESIVLAQNYDFYYGHGLVLSNVKGLSKVALSDNLSKEDFYSDNITGAKWESKYGSITFNQFGKEMPICGMNDQGLAITSMRHNVEKGIYEKGRDEITELQWIQMQLDLYASIDEVKNNLLSVLYHVEMFPMHYHISDNNGKSAIIEYKDGKLFAYDSDDICACGNAGLEESLEYAQKYSDVQPEEIKIRKPILDRVTKAILLSKKRNSLNDSSFNATEKAFEILDSVNLQVAFSDLFRRIGKGVPPSQTFLQVVFDIKNMKVLFKTKGNREIREISLQELNFDTNGGFAFDIEEPSSGNITTKLHNYTRADNERIVKKSFAPMKKEFPIEEQNELIEYPEYFRVVR